MKKTSAHYAPEESGGLDALLAQWGERHALPSATAESIRVAVLAEILEPVELPYQWWAGFFGNLTASVNQTRKIPNNMSLWQGPAFAAAFGVTGNRIV